MKRCFRTTVLFALGLLLTARPQPAVGEEKKADAPLKAGMIGLDTSHVTAFAGLLANADPKSVLADIKLVAAFPGGSPDVPASKDRIEGFTATLRDKYKIEIVDSIDKLLSKVDVIFLESVDGRPHLEQARPVLKARKPLFI